jgi:hypothetical protein
VDCWTRPRRLATRFTFDRWQSASQFVFGATSHALRLLQATARVIYDHSVRSDDGFTDHSALIVDLVAPHPKNGDAVWTQQPQAVKGRASQDNSGPQCRAQINPHKTAIRRSSLPIARCLYEQDSSRRERESFSILAAATDLM